MPRIDPETAFDACRMLLSLEWAITSEGDASAHSCCPDCGQPDFRGHREGCELGEMCRRIRAAGIEEE